MKEKFKNYKQRFLLLLKDGKFSRLGRNFETTNHKYYYDTGTGKVFQINDTLNAILTTLIKTNNFDSIFELSLDDDALLKALDEMFDTVDEQHILQAHPVLELYGPQVYELNEGLTSQRTQVMLELTEKCNMRCKYCIYHSGNGGYREFGKNDMTFEVAKLALDQFLVDSQKEELYVSFYGGEPLLRFDMIKMCVEYCTEMYPNKNIRYTMTTNATLMTEAIASYLSSLPQAIITVSLDGPEEVHDKYRVFPNNTGTFQRTMEGLKKLVDAYGERAKECLIINTVIAEYDEETLIKVQGFFDTLDWLPKDIMHTSSYVDSAKQESDYGGVDSEKEEKIRQYAKASEMNYNPIGTWGTRKFMNGNSSEIEIEELARDGFIKDLISVHRRFLVDKPASIYGMNGCCVPGSRKIYVTVKGEYLVCEKMGPSPKIGDVYNGIDIARIREFYVERFRNEAVQYCKNCWAINLCNVCYTECYDENDVNFRYRHSRCEAHRISKEKTLTAYHEIMEKSPESLHFLNDYEFA